ncbi:EamA family transporter [Microlunatus flavus]|uniref:EamA family transporter n=1 Tax=Microlunatus flavus TaxID=1036181 RepID=UPI000B87068F|nr:EamA family transporter [Microlunatus flavus]
MPIRDRLLALVVAVVWGVNFPATAFGLQHFPPLLMVAVRFTLVAVPTVLLVPRPRVPLRWFLGAAVFMGTVQFALLYVAMALGMPSGLASLVLQACAPFTVVLGALLLREHLGVRQVVGVVAAVVGLGVIALHRALGGSATALVPVLLTIAAGLGWAVGNICSRQARAAKPLHFTLWLSVVPPVPLLALSLLVEGPQRDRAALSTAFTVEALPAVLGLLYIVLVATVLGYGLWNTLLSRNPAGVVAPFAMLVPVAGVLSAWLVLGEVPDLVELLAGVLVVGGVLFGSRPARRPLVAPTPTPVPLTKSS